jgi:hypothetical protein
MKFNKTALFAMLFTSLFLSGFISKAFADDDDFMSDLFGAKPTDFIKSRSYIGAVGISSTLDQWGDFNGSNSLVYGPVTYETSPVTALTNIEYDLIPSITRSYGWGVLVGQREGPWAVEASFWRSDHTASFFAGGATITEPASLQSINIDFKRYLFTQLPTQPFVSVGVSFPWLWVRQFSSIYTPTSPPTYLSTNDETISGIGFNLGAGLEIYLDNNFSLVGGAYQRWTGFNQVNGAEKIGLASIYFDGDPNSTLPTSNSTTGGVGGANNIGALEGDGLNLYVGTTFGFQ